MEELTPKNSELSTEAQQENTLFKGKALHITPETENIDFSALLGRLVQYVNMGDIVSKIQTGSRYVVQIPAEYQAAFDAGELSMMKNKATGKMWPNLVEIAENGKNKIVTPLSIAEQKFIQGNPVQDLANSYHNFLMQKQMQEISAKLDTILEAAARIEEGQMNDRLADFDAGRNKLIFALFIQNEEERIKQIRAGRDTLINAQAKVGRALQSMADRFEPVPKDEKNLYACEVMKGGYLRNKDREFHLMQEYYDYYLKTTKLIAISFAMCDEPDAAEQTYQMAEDFLSGVNFSAVQTIKHMHKGVSGLFCSSPVKYLSIEKMIFLDEARNYDYVAIEVSGAELQEVLSDGRTKEISENHAEQ